MSIFDLFANVIFIYSRQNYCLVSYNNHRFISKLAHFARQESVSAKLGREVFRIVRVEVWTGIDACVSFYQRVRSRAHPCERKNKLLLKIQTFIDKYFEFLCSLFGEPKHSH